MLTTSGPKNGPMRFEVFEFKSGRDSIDQVEIVSKKSWERVLVEFDRGILGLQMRLREPLSSCFR